MCIVVTLEFFAPLLALNVRRPWVSLYHVYLSPSKETFSLKLQEKIAPYYWITFKHGYLHLITLRNDTIPCC